jgi:hypothetical protein
MKKKQTLLDKAISKFSISPYRSLTEEEINLVLAWAEGKIGTSQVDYARGQKNSAFWLAQTLRELVARKILVRKKG